MTFCARPQRASEQCKGLGELEVARSNSAIEIAFHSSSPDARMVGACRHRPRRDGLAGTRQAPS